MKNTFQKQLWWGFGIILGFTIISAVAIYILSGDVDAETAKIMDDKNLIAGQAVAVGVLANLKSQAPVAAQYTTAIDTLLPTHDALIGFSSWVAKIGSNHDVSASITFQATGATSTATTVGTNGFSLNATGALSDLTAFMTDLETKATGFLLSLSSFSLTINGSGYQLTAQGTVYSR